MKNRKKDVTTELEESFKALILKYPFEKITIKMITDGAGLIRPTFYNHYADKYEMLEVICYKDIFEGSELLIENNMTIEAVNFVFTRIEKNKEFYIRAIKIKGQNAFEDMIYINLVIMFTRYFELHGKNKVIKNEVISQTNVAEYYAKGLTFIIIRWIESGIKISSKELVDDYKIIVSSSIEEIAKELF